VTPQGDLAPNHSILQLFKDTGAYLQGHFRLSSGLHSAGYMQSALVLRHPKYAEFLGRRLASLLSSYAADFVVSPALGGMIVGHEVARAVSLPFLFTERDADRKMSLRRGFTIEPGTRAIIIEDVITTGGSTREVIEIVRAAAAIPVAAGSIIDRSGGAAGLGIPHVALETLSVPTFDPGQCPMCAAGEPVTKPGSRPV
jgi:orotate phosphoribosyltransferase